MSTDGAAPVVVNQQSSAEVKIRLFRSLFRGREDVYPRRFESRKTGKSGYAPACANEWVRGICEKPRIKCAECQHRRFLPVTDDVIRWHLSGEDEHRQPFVAGVYPLLLDESCYFLAADFDKANWQDDAAAFLQTCRRLDLDAALERSRSGRGGHVWIFFEQAIPAALARRLGSHLLTETMEGRPDVGPGFVRPAVSQSRHVAAGRIRQPHRPAAAEGAARARPQRLPRRAFRAVGRPVGVSGAHPQGRTRAGRTPRAGGRTPRPHPRRAAAAPGRRRRRTVDHAALPSPSGAADRRRPPVNAGAGPRQPDLHRQGRAQPWASESPAPTGGVSESGVLQGAGDAAVDVRQAARHRLRRGPPASHRPSARLSRRGATARSKTLGFARPFATNATPVDRST